MSFTLIFGHAGREGETERNVGLHIFVGEREREVRFLGGVVTPCIRLTFTIKSLLTQELNEEFL